MCWKVKFPLPPQEVKANNRYAHWTKRSSASNDYKDECTLLIRQAQIKGTFTRQSVKRAKVTYAFSLLPDKRGDGKHRPKDWLNAAYSVKALEDALVQSGVLIDDSWEHVQGQMVRNEVGEPCVIVTIEEIYG